MTTKYIQTSRATILQIIAIKMIMLKKENEWLTSASCEFHSNFPTVFIGSNSGAGGGGMTGMKVGTLPSSKLSFMQKRQTWMSSIMEIRSSISDDILSWSGKVENVDKEVTDILTMWGRRRKESYNNWP